MGRRTLAALGAVTVALAWAPTAQGSAGTLLSGYQSPGGGQQVLVNNLGGGSGGSGGAGGVAGTHVSAPSSIVAPSASPATTAAVASARRPGPGSPRPFGPGHPGPRTAGGPAGGATSPPGAGAQAAAASYLHDGSAGPIAPARTLVLLAAALALLGALGWVTFRVAASPRREVAR